jgi:hypothetical protein
MWMTLLGRLKNYNIIYLIRFAWIIEHGHLELGVSTLSSNRHHQHIYAVLTSHTKSVSDNCSVGILWTIECDHTNVPLHSDPLLGIGNLAGREREVPKQD